MAEEFVDKNMGYVDPAVAGKSSIAQTEEVARKVAADTQKITTLESQAAEAPKETDSGFGVLADVALDALGIGPVGKMVSAGLTMAEDMNGGTTGASASMSSLSQAPAEDVFAKMHKETTRAPGLYREESPQTGTYGGDPKKATFAAPSSARTSGLFERVSIASSTLQKQDSAGLVDTTPKNLATMDSNGAAEKITARVAETKQQVSALKNAHELAQQSIRPAMEANYAARAVAARVSPGMAMSMNGPSFNPDQIIGAAKGVSEWNDPDRWRNQQA